MIQTHMVLALLTVLLITSGILVAAALKKRRWWLRTHKTIETLALAATIATITAAWLMVRAWQGSHLDSAHGYFGVTGATCTLIALCLGISQFRYPSRRRILRPAHRAAGFIAALVMVITAIIGLSMTGMIF